MSLNPEAIMFYADHPVEFVEDIIRARPDRLQREMLQSVADNPLTSVRSGHGVGKSAVESWLIIWFLSTRPYPKIPCTAPTKHQLYDILWAEVSKWLRNNPVLEKDIIWTQEKVFMRGYREEWFAVARTASKPDALQGFHASHVLYIIDEASGVDDKVFEPILGALTTEGSRLFMAGNPTKLTGFFFDSHHKNRAQYHTMHIDGRDSSRVDETFVQTIIEMFGEDSDVFRVRVAGDFPRALPDSFIPMEWAERASEAPAPEITRAARVDIGIDVARYGDDSSVMCPVLDKGCRKNRKFTTTMTRWSSSAAPSSLSSATPWRSPGPKSMSKSTATAWASASLTASWSCGNRSPRKWRSSARSSMRETTTRPRRLSLKSMSATLAGKAER